MAGVEFDKDNEYIVFNGCWVCTLCLFSTQYCFALFVQSQLVYPKFIVSICMFSFAMVVVTSSISLSRGCGKSLFLYMPLTFMTLPSCMPGLWMNYCVIQLETAP